MQTPFLTSSAMALDLGEEQLDQLRDVMPRALAVSGLATKGDTYYNSGAEQRALVGGCIAALMAIDRGLAAASAVLPGVKDFWRGAVVTMTGPELNWLLDGDPACQQVPTQVWSTTSSA